MLGELVKEVLGPRQGAYESLPLDMDPRNEYIVGVLGPKEAKNERDIDAEAELVDNEDGEMGEDEKIDTTEAVISGSPSLDPKSLPKSMGFSFIVKTTGDNPQLDVCFTWAKYYSNGQEWTRQPYFHYELFKVGSSCHSVDKDNTNVAFFIRSSFLRENHYKVSVFLVNSLVLNSEIKPSTPDFIFQPEIRLNIVADCEICPIEDNQIEFDDSQESIEEASLKLLYKNRNAYARGHLVGVTVKNTTNKHVGNQKYHYLLKSLLKCAHCGRSWDATTYSGRADKDTGLREKYRCYRCPNLNPKKYGPELSKCPSQMIRAELLEEFVWSEVTRFVTDPEYFIKHIQGRNESGIDDIRERIKIIQQQLETKEKEKEKLKIMFKRDVITEEEMVREMKQINNETIVLNDELNRYNNHIAAQQKEQLETEHILNLVNQISVKLSNPDDIDFDFKRHIIEMLFEQILIKCEDNNEISITSVGTFDKLLGKNDVRLCSQRQFKL